MGTVWVDNTDPSVIYSPDFAWSHEYDGLAYNETEQWSYTNTLFDGNSTYKATISFVGELFNPSY